ncbi:MAG: AmmeMemoRadiSam system protein B [Gammaproteobacteria bacterium]|nr:AmmeMemoRadiSam system protein B [Gammaproteobacteria bacterium]
MPIIRAPAVAGSFYPADPEEIRSQISAFISDGKPGRVPAPKALIAPHAGYVYSGPVAGSAYAQLEQVADRITRVVILAPAHRMAFSGVACSRADFFRTPLGDVAVDVDAMKLISDLPQINSIDQAFNGEHSIEVHLPFLQETLKHFRIVPLLVSDASAQDVEQVLEKLWGGSETLILISSDLSHYLDYESASAMDTETTRAIEALDHHKLDYHRACGRTPVSGLLLSARHHQLSAVTLDQRNSGDTAGPKTQVVGYGAYAFH